MSLGHVEVAGGGWRIWLVDYVRSRLFLRLRRTGRFVHVGMGSLAFFSGEANLLLVDLRSFARIYHESRPKGLARVVLSWEIFISELFICLSNISPSQWPFTLLLLDIENPVFSRSFRPHLLLDKDRIHLLLYLNRILPSSVILIQGVDGLLRFLLFGLFRIHFELGVMSFEVADTQKFLIFLFLLVFDVRAAHNHHILNFLFLEAFLMLGSILFVILEKRRFLFSVDLLGVDEVGLVVRSLLGHGRLDDRLLSGNIGMRLHYQRLELLISIFVLVCTHTSDSLAKSAESREIRAMISHFDPI